MTEEHNDRIGRSELRGEAQPFQDPIANRGKITTPSSEDTTMPSKIAVCPDCQIYFEQDYAYCPRCGTELIEVEQDE